MSRKKLVLVYHPDNQDAAQKIDTQLSPFGYSFKHLDSSDTAIGEQILETALPAVLLVSDNFFKSPNCMENAMSWTRKMMNLNLLLPVVVEGKETNLETGEVISHPTIFQRVSDVIKYMNYWQDQYLLLRKKRRTAPLKNEPALSMQLQVVKNISAEIGEYLRFLKTSNPEHLEELTSSGYAAFFQFTKDEAGLAGYQSKHQISGATAVAAPTVTEVKPIVDTPAPVVPPKQEFKTINERLAQPKVEEKTEDIPVFEPAIVSQEAAVVAEEITEKVEDEIPVFVPAFVPERVSNGVKKAENAAVKAEDEIPVFVPAVVPDRSKEKAKVVDNEPTANENGAATDESQSLVDIIQASSEALLAENEKEKIENIEEGVPPVDLSTLPGMELLAAKEETTRTKIANPEGDFINAIDAFGEIDEDDMEFEEEEIGNLEDLAEEVEVNNAGVSMNELNQIVEEVIEEEAREANDLEQNDEEELSDLLNILEDNQAQDEVVVDEIFNEDESVSVVADATQEATENADEMADLFEENEVEAVAATHFEVDENDIKDEELMRLVAEVENQNEAAEAEERQAAEAATATETDPEPEKEMEERDDDEVEEEDVENDGDDDFADIFEEDEEDEIYVQTDTLISRAYQYFEAEDWDGGLAVLEDGVVQTPENSDLRFQYALALAKHKNDFGGATRQLEILLGFDQQHEEAYFLLGELSEMHKDYLMARNYYEKVAAINDDFPEIYYRLGIITNLHFDDQKEEAAAYLKKAIKKNKLNADAHYRLGILMNEHFGNHLKAVKYFKKVLNVQPEHPFANYDLAILYHRLNDRALANIYYQKAVDINPELKTPDNDEAFKYELIGNVEEVIPLTTEDSIEDAELARNMARLEAKMANIAEQNAAMKNQILGELDAEFGENAMEDLYEEEIREAPVAAIPAMPKPVCKTILITGATSGIGRATAEIFAENGYQIIMTGRRAERLEALKEDFETRFNSKVKTLPFDVRNVDEVQAAIDSLESEWREIDILLNNAGLAKGTGPIHEGNLHHWEQMIDTNIKGLLYMTRAIVPHMVSNREGHIINIASSAGKEVYPGGNVYCATKHAVDALTRAMRIDLHTHNVRVSQVAPGMVEETEFSLVRYDGDGKKAKIYEDFNPLTARDVAEVIYFVATRPKHVNVQDVLMFGTQQANSIYTNRDGRSV